MIAAMYRFVVDVPLRWVDVDSEGVVNNAVYLSLMEQARFLYFEELGLLRARRIEFVLAEAAVKFLKPGRMGMRPQVAACTKSLGGSSFRMAFEVRANDDVLASCEAVLVFVDDEMKSRPIPEHARQALAAFEQISPGHAPS